MIELFAFEVYKKEAVVSEHYIERFIAEFLDNYSLFWGGGYDPDRIRGVISTGDDNEINIDSVVGAFVRYFGEHDRIKIDLDRHWFKKIDLHAFGGYENLDLKKAEDW